MQRQYQRYDVEYESWYSTWMKQLAANYSKPELEGMLHGASKEAKKYAAQHLAAIEKSGSMQGNSSNRAASRVCVAASGEKATAIRGAIEIHELFPEHAKTETS